MKKVISISTDRKIFAEGSVVRKRQIDYGNYFDELHIIVFTRLTHFLPTEVQIAPNVWVYGTHSISKLLYVNGALKMAARIIRQRKITATNAVVTTQDPFETGLVGLKIKERFGLPLQMQIHTDFLSPYFMKDSLLNRFRVRIAKKNLLKANGIRVVSKRIADSLKATLLKLKIEPKVLPIFVDVEKISSTPVTVNLREKYPQFNFLILMASRFTKEKNIPLAIKAFKNVVDVYPNAGLVLVGSGLEESRLKKLVRALKIDKNVVFEPWRADLVSYYKTANLFVLTSNYEGYGLTLVEAVAARCPVVSTDVGIAADLLRGDSDARASLVCPVGDMACLFEKITAVIEDMGLRERAVVGAGERLDSVAYSTEAEYLEKYAKCLNEI